MAWPSPKGLETYHTTPYPAISPTLPSLSASGKVILITGGGSNLGLAFTRAFAQAGSTCIAITGRREHVLLNAKKTIEAEFPGCKILPCKGDVADKAAVDDAFAATVKEFGKIDVVISNAGYLPDYRPIGSDRIEDWWGAYEVNVKGTHNVMCAFLQALKTATKTQEGEPVFINLTSLATNALVPHQSGYGTSKLAASKLVEYFQDEHPEIRAINIAPGIVLTDMHRKTIAALEERGMGRAPEDDIELPAGFMVWAASPEASCLKGKIVWVNWDVEELRKTCEENRGRKDFLTFGTHGIPNLYMQQGVKLG